MNCLKESFFQILLSVVLTVNNNNWLTSWKGLGKYSIMITFSKTPKQRTSVVTFGNTQLGPYYWVGNCKNGINYYAGQTFKTPAEGVLKGIKVFSSIIHGTAEATLSIYEFDAVNHTWKEKRGETIKRITKALENQWINFDLSGIEVKQGAHYGFKITCDGDGMVAIAECPWKISNPYKDGLEWVGSSYMKEGKFQEDFDFAFEGEIETSADAQFI